MPDRAELRSEIQRLKRRNAELEAQNRRLREFAMAAFHDLQEPLRKLGTFTDLLEQAHAKADRAEASYAISVLRRSSRQVQQLVKDILAYSRATRSDLVREPVAVKAVIDEVLSAVSGTVVETSAILRVSVEPATVSADRMQVFHMLLNLVSNGLKFYETGTEPYVELRAMRENDGSIRLAVRDRGIGFDPTAAASVFEPFRRLNTRSAYGGSGLGLAIVQSIAERHGWTVAVDTAPGKGSAFEIRVPVEDVLD